MEQGAGTQAGGEIRRDPHRGPNRPGRSPVRFVPYDRLTLKSREEDTGISHWTGERGVYVMQPTGVVEVNRPVMRVYLNRKYFTGLFTGKRPGEFSGDLKEPDRKRYLTFRKVDPETLEIVERVRLSVGKVA